MQKRKEELFCSECESQIIKSYGQESKMRAKLIKWNRNGMYAVCKSCGHEESIGIEVIKSMTNFTYEIQQLSDKE